MGESLQLVSDFEPRGDQPQAIDELCAGLDRGDSSQVLLGVTGSGKTFTVAKVIEHYGKPALILAPNKTLAAQLYGEMRELFPHNAVHYFVSYYDYYQPEAYLPASDTFIEKDAIINDAIDRMRHAATHALLSRDDVIIVASVSCIYGMGSAESYHGMLVSLERGMEVPRDDLLRKLVDLQYERNDVDFHRSTFRVRGDVVEIFPAYEEAKAIRIELWGDEIEAIKEIDPLRGKVLGELDRYAIYPSSHYVTERQQLDRAIESIRVELAERSAEFTAEMKLLERQRIEERTLYDLEMLEQMGFCTGIENYSRHISGRKPGEPPPTLMDYFPEDFLLIIDESHQTVPQLGAMYRGDRSRKETLVGHGFRLPSALDNRPLKFDEFSGYMRHLLFVSATPGDYELEQTGGTIVEQIIRPTGLVDPTVLVRPVQGQVDDLLGCIRERVAVGERVLVTTLTKRMAEDLTEYYVELGVRCRYLHSDIDTLERIEILRDLRAGEFDVLVGINLLREGLDLPEVSLVAILDADKEGFLRSARSLIQTSGRAARNVHGTVIFFADRMTQSMNQAIEETTRRRSTQLAYNEEHGITPRTIQKAILDLTPTSGNRDYYTVAKSRPDQDDDLSSAPRSEDDLLDYVEALRQQMFAAAESLEFEKAARLRDQLAKLREEHGDLLAPSASHGGQGGAGKRRSSQRPSGRPQARNRRASPPSPEVSLSPSGIAIGPLGNTPREPVRFPLMNLRFAALLVAIVTAGPACDDPAKTARSAPDSSGVPGPTTSHVGAAETSSDAVATAVATAPDGSSSAVSGGSPKTTALSAERFRALVKELSEPDAEFFSDNFVSNETSYLQGAADLRRSAQRGGVYIGVGPEQNFTYIALTGAERAYIIDIRRDNLVLHLLYKAIFDLARSRSEFLALLVARPYEADTAPSSHASLEDVIAHAERLPASSDGYDEIHSRVVHRIETTYGIKLSRKDRKSLATAHKALHRDGLDIRFKLKEKSFRRYPSLRALLAAKDPTEDQQLGFLASEATFRFVQRMQRDNRLIPLVGNFGGDRALKNLAQHLRADELTVSAFYVSNVEQYLLQDGLWWKWTRNIEALPTDDKSLFIRCYLNQGRRHPRELEGHRTTTVLQRMSDFLAQNDKKPYRSMYQLSVDEWRPSKSAPDAAP